MAKSVISPTTRLKAITNLVKLINIPVSLCKHLLHCALLIITIILFTYLNVRIDDNAGTSIDPIVQYGQVGTILLYLLRLFTYLSLPQVIFNFCGLICFNAFNKVKLIGSPTFTPFICIRIVTRGNFAELVKANVIRNMNTCLNVGLKNFCVEVVTDKAIDLPAHHLTREIVVPETYQTKTGAMFKSRALQYCLEDGVNQLDDNDWIVHLDEETLLTENSVRGIVNFALDGRHAFGQGLITYANEHIVNWITTLADSFRVSDDMGKVRFQFKVFHRPLLSWKGSYVVARAHAERKISFDHGLNGSIAEDCFFGMLAFAKGYSFDFIEGEMYEKSPFTIMDFVQQRKRWLQGILLVVHSPEIPFRYKILLATSLYAWILLPLSTAGIILTAISPFRYPLSMDLLSGFIGGVYIYMYFFGVLKSYSVHNFGTMRFVACAIFSICVIPINMVIENVAVIWGLFGGKHKFYVVQKNLPHSNRLHYV